MCCMPTPALLTRPWTAPKRSTALRTAAVQSAQRVTSQSMGWIRSSTCCARASSASSRMSAWLDGRSATATRTPALARPSAMARPRPRAPPVTIAARSDGATPMMDNTVSFGSTSHCGRRCAPREGLRRGTAPMLGFAVKTIRRRRFRPKIRLKGGGNATHMKFGIFDYIDARGETLQQTYEDRLALLQAAEAAGFHGYHLTEHHATPLSMTPSPSVFLAAAARETRRIRLGTLLYLLPLYHPLRLLEELCMLDHLSGGRLDIGVGRGISPMEFDAYDVDFEQAGADYEHVLNVLYQGFTQERIDYRCDRFTFKDVPVVIRPLQRPHPPLWYGLRGDHGPVFAAQHGMHGVTLGPDAKVANMLATF